MIMLKKILYNAVGVLSLANTKVKELIEDFIQNGDYTEDEGKRIVEGIFGNVLEAGAEWQNQLKSNIDQLTSKLNLPNSEKLTEFIQQLKDQLNKLSLNSK